MSSVYGTFRAPQFLVGSAQNFIEMLDKNDKETNPWMVI